MNVAIIGTNTWARALATLVAEAGVQPKIGYREAPMSGFPGSPNLEAVVMESDLVFIAEPADAAREALLACRLTPQDHVIVASRGIEPATGRWLTDVVTETSPCLRVGTLAGPALAAEVLRRRPTALVVASPYQETAKRAQRVLHSRLCRAYTSSDMRGVEIAGAMVGVLAAAVGISDALELGLGMHGVIVTRGIAEAQRFGVCMGAKEATFSGLAGVGNLISSAAHPDNPWYIAGKALAEGESMDPELADAAQAIVALAKKSGVELPISSMVSLAAEGKVEPTLAIDALMRREARAEA